MQNFKKFEKKALFWEKHNGEDLKSCRPFQKGPKMDLSLVQNFWLFAIFLAIFISSPEKNFSTLFFSVFLKNLLNLCSNISWLSRYDIFYMTKACTAASCLSHHRCKQRIERERIRDFLNASGFSSWLRRLFIAYAPNSAIEKTCLFPASSEFKTS